MRWLRSVSVSVVLAAFCFLFGRLAAQERTPIDPNFTKPLLAEEGGPIDIVYTWVDGSDPEWRQARKTWIKRTKNVAKEAKRVIRFRNHDELKYSLRSIRAFAPFVRHIFIVTAGQRPQWLVDDPQISVVYHNEIFSKPNYLPTFNSMAIEANLHHIPGLASRYIYFNDDVLLGRPVTEEDFFVDSNTIKVFLSDKKIASHKKARKSGLYQTVARNTAKFLEKELRTSELKVSKNDFYYHLHTPFPMVKRIAELTEKRFSRAFDKGSSHRFRSKKDLCITNGLIPQYALLNGVGVAASAETMVAFLKGDAPKDTVGLNALLDKKPMFFCVQDSADKTNEAELDCLKTFFETYFPEPAPWEKKVETNE